MVQVKVFQVQFQVIKDITIILTWVHMRPAVWMLLPEDCGMLLSPAFTDVHGIAGINPLPAARIFTAKIM